MKASASVVAPFIAPGRRESISEAGGVNGAKQRPRGSVYDSHWRLGMADERQLRPATAAKLEDTLTLALRFKGRKRWDGASPLIPAIDAARLRAPATSL
jgi:hypothetical protein